MTENATEQMASQWRVCGDDPARGPWEGTWRTREITANDRYDAAEMAKRNERVWFEYREVFTRTSPVRRVPVDAPKVATR